MKSGGLGISLRLEFIDEFLALRPRLPIVEVIADNFLNDGPHHKKLEAIRRDYDISLHCVGMNLAGFDALDRDYLKRIRELQNRFQPKLLSDHLAIQSHEGQHFHDLLPFPRKKSDYERIKARLLDVQEYFNRQILIENLSSYVHFEDDSMSEVEMLSGLCSEAGCGLLLDVHNLWVNEQNHAIKAQDYFDQLPQESIQEIHIAGGSLHDGTWIDTHCGEPPAEVIAWSQRFSDRDCVQVYEQDQNLEDLAATLAMKQIIEGFDHEAG